MSTYSPREVERILLKYDPEHDTDPGLAPVTWREERIATFVLKLFEDIEELKTRMQIFEDILKK